MQEYEKRLRNEKLLSLVTTAEEAAKHITSGMVIGVSGFTPTGYPKAVPRAVSERVREGERLRLTLYSGASLGPEVDGDWAELGILERRLPYQTNGTLRQKINEGDIRFIDMHLSHSPQYVSMGMLPPVDVAIIEAAAITEEGHIVPTAGIGNSPVFVKSAAKVIVELNISKPEALEGMADVCLLENPPARSPIGIERVSDRIGRPYIECGPEKIAAIVVTELQDQTRELRGSDHVSEQISNHIIRFLQGEVAAGRLTNELLPLQSGVGSVANAVLYGLCRSEFENLTCYSEVIQDSMLDLLRSGKAVCASATAISPSPGAMAKFEEELEFFKDKIILRPQEISNNPEVARRLGVISINTALEADIYGNINSTHVMGTRLMNGIGGSGDFARSAAITIFTTESTAKNGSISSIVPMVSHVDHPEHDVMVLVTEQGYADLRGLCPKERAAAIIENCVHPDYKEQLWDYFNRALARGASHTPHLLEEALSWHTRYMETGSMKK